MRSMVSTALTSTICPNAPLSVNLPHGYKFCNASPAGTFMIGGIGAGVKSWEVA